jgi:hypothetical protein
MLKDAVRPLIRRKSTATNWAICCFTSNWTMLYFIKSGNYCKVGYTKNSKAFFERMRKYLTHNPSFQILDIQKGDLTDEKMIHYLIPK